MTLHSAISSDHTSSTDKTSIRFGSNKIPGLIRAVLVDSMSPGRVAELPLDGHCLVTGSNAAGKTSLIQLVTLFQGVSPNEISKKREHKAFIPYYLPRTTSYIAFEYLHRGGSPRTVIVYADRTETDLRYRFVRSGIYQDMFVTDDANLVQSPNLSRHMKERGYDVVDRAIDTLSDYKKIIQGLKTVDGTPERKRFMAQTTNDFAMAYPGTPLKSIERVVAAMLKKNGSLNALEEMISGKILGDEPDVRVSGDHKRLSNWPDQFRAYTEVMRHDSKARQLNSKKIELDRLNADIADTFSEMHAIYLRDQAEMTALERTIGGLKKNLKSERTAYDVAKEDLHETTIDANTALSTAQERISKIERQNTDSKNAGIIAAVQLAETAASLRHQKTSLQKEIKALTGKKRDIEVEFEELKQQTHENYNTAFGQISDRKTDRGLSCDAELSELDTIHSGRAAKIEASHEKRLVRCQAAIQTAGENHAVAKERAQNPQVSQNLIEARNAAQEIVNNKNADYCSALEVKSDFEEALRSTKSELSRIEAKIRSIGLKMDEARALRRDVQAEKKPDAGSLLEFLRTSSPDWGDNIAKVIHPDLLKSTDLDPEMSAGDGALFGLSLNLAGVEPHSSADVSKFDERIEAITDEIEELEEENKNLAKLEQAASRAKANAQRAVNENDAVLRTGKSKLDTAQKVVSDREKDITDARANAKSTAEAYETSCLETLKQNREDSGVAIEARKTEIAVQKDKNSAEIAAVKRLAKIDSDALTQEQSDLKKQRDLRISELDDTLANHLSEAGIDANYLHGIKSRLDDASKKITSIETNAARVAEWLRFVQDDLPRLPALREDEKDRKTERDEAQEKEANLNGSWKKRSENLKGQIEKSDHRLATLNKDVDRAAKRLQESEGYTRNNQRVIIRNLDEIILALRTQQDTEKSLEKAVERGVEDLVKIFRSVSNSPPEQYLTQSMENLPSKIGSEWLVAILGWFDHAHTTYRDTLMTEAQAMTNDITSTSRRLERLEKSISAENRRLQTSLSRNNRLDVVSDIGVTIKSSIRELNFVPAMNRLADIHDKWVASGDVMPPADFISAMEEMLTYWRADGISANLASHIKIVGYVVENGSRREFTSTTDLASISSNGVSYLILTIILVAFLNMIRGEEKRVRMVWALDELSNIDANNTRRLLDMLRENDITLIAATPQSEADVRRHFDYQIRVMNDRRLAHIKGSNARPIGIDWSQAIEVQPQPAQNALALTSSEQKLNPDDQNQTPSEGA